MLAIVEKTRTSSDHATRGAIVHNIGSCLHNLGEFEAAQAYYEQAVESFRKASSPLVDRLFYGDINRRRIEFVKERLIDISWGRKPDEDKYLNEFGYKRDAPRAPHSTPGNASLSQNWENEPPPPMDYDYAANPPRWLAGMDGAGSYSSCGAGSSDKLRSAHQEQGGFTGSMADKERREVPWECSAAVLCVDPVQHDVLTCCCHSALPAMPAARRLGQSRAVGSHRGNVWRVWRVGGHGEGGKSSGWEGESVRD